MNGSDGNDGPWLGARDGDPVEPMSRSETEEYVERLVLTFGPDGHPPVPDQATVIREFGEGTGRVAVDAAAGTGKTTTMLYAVAEAVLRKTRAAPDRNPFEDVLVTTFTRDAAAELQTGLKDLLRAHREAGGEVPASAFRWIDTASYVQTMDSLFHELLTEVSLEVGIPPDFEIEPGVELQQIREHVLADLRVSHREAFETLEEAYPAESWREYPPDSVSDLLVNAHQKCRELGVTPGRAEEMMLTNLARAHGDHTPPRTLADVEDLLERVVRPGASVSTAPALDDAESRRRLDEFVAHVEETHERSRELIVAFTSLLEAYDEAYDERTREEGAVTFTDATHLLRSYLRRNADGAFARSLGDRFDAVFVDEFQDTSIAQCDVLDHFVPRDDDTRLLLIGDVKQSIYEWRSADPSIFAEIVRETDGSGAAHIPYLDVDDVAYHALSSNFRSHGDVVAATNALFGDVFDDPTRGGISDAVAIDYKPVEARGPSARVEDGDPRLHVLDLGLEDERFPSRGEAWVPREAERVAETIAAMVDADDPETAPVTVVDGVDESDEPTLATPDPGDVTLLFRTTSFMRQYAEALERYGIRAAPAATEELFEQPEVRLLVDVLYWFANPHDEGSLLRILRSPLVACDDATLRALATREFYLERLLDRWPDDLPAGDRERIEALIELRDALRWEREGSKPDLIHRILRHSGFDSVVLADPEGLRRYGNLWRLTTIVSEWESEELLPYREFVDRLVTLRERAADADASVESVDLADPEDRTAVTLTTVHAAKGREFPVVFLCDLLKQSTLPSTQHERLLVNRRNGFALRPVPSDRPFPTGVTFPTPDDDGTSAWIHTDRDSGDFPDLTGPVWISDARTAEGHLEYRNPLNDFIEDEQAEFWRMFYVAVTRAADHLFVGTSDLQSWVERGDFAGCTTWVAAFNDQFRPEEGWTSVDVSTAVPVDGGPSDPETIPVGVDDVPAGDPTETRSFDLPDLRGLLESRPAHRSEEIPFRPVNVTARGAHDLIECPRRFQYHHVQEVATDRGYAPTERDEGGELTGPSSIDAVPDTVWGEFVHEALEHRVAGRPAYRSFLETIRDDSVRDAVANVVGDARRRTTELHEATSEDADVYPELSVSTVVDADGEVRFDGEIDLLYEYDRDWYLADYKTAPHPDGQGDVDERYVRQLQTYAWILEREYGIAVREASLIFIDLDADPTCVSVPVPSATETARFESALRDALGSLSVESEDGLRAVPGDHCANCPYAARRGGPCEHGSD